MALHATTSLGVLVMRYVPVLLVLVLLLLAPRALDAQSTANIVPGKGIGPIEIGMSMDSVQALVAQFGQTEVVDTPTERGVCNPERGVGVCAFDRFRRLGLEQPGSVVFIVTDDARFTTDTGGHKVGATLLDFLRTYGLYNFGQRTEIRWESKGLSVTVGANDQGIVVNFIGVFAPRGASAQLRQRSLD